MAAQLKAGEPAVFPPREAPSLFDFSVCDLLDDAVSRAPREMALVLNSADGAHIEQSWTYEALRRDALKAGALIAAQCRPGEHIAILGPNSPAWTLIQLGAAYAGVTVVTLNPALRGPEIEYQLKQSRTVMLFTERAYRGYALADAIAEMRDRLPDLREVHFMDDAANRVAAAPDVDGAALPGSKPQDAAMIMYTSGTTGKPKGVRLTHHGVVNNAALGSHRFQLGEGKVWLGVLPLFHIGGAIFTTLACIANVGKNIVMPAFEPGLALKLIADQKINWLPAVPTMLYAMAEHENFQAADLSSLEMIIMGGTVVPPDLVRMVERDYGVGVQVMFGQTEAGGGMCMTYRDDPIEKIAQTVGAPYPCTTMKIQNLDTETPAAIDEPGEIRIKSPFMMAGYFDNEAGTKDAFDADGFLRTGDLGVMDGDGYLKIAGRIKDMILRGGENIYAREVEDALCEHDAVSEVAAVGAPHEKWGEEVAAFIRLTPGQNVTSEELEKFITERIARYKRPRIWRFVDDFPRTAMGKIKKFELVKLLSAEE